MKTGIHPQYYDNTEVRCACGNVLLIGSTKQQLKTELCSACHPFYTGKQKLVDTAGRVDKFEARRKAAQLHKEARAEAQKAQTVKKATEKAASAKKKTTAKKTKKRA